MSNDSYNYKNGPIKDRKCTDVFCCILFLVFIAASIGVAIYALMNGNPAILAKPFDPDHRVCGEKEMKDFPFIYFANPYDLSRTVCLKQCPDGEEEILQCSPNSKVKSCDVGTDDDGESTIVYSTVGFYQKLCLPDTISDHTSDDNLEYFDKIQDILKFDSMETIMNDLNKSWFIIVGSIFITIILSFLFMYLIRWFSALIIWIFIIFTMICLLALGIMLFANYNFHNSNNSDFEKLNQINFLKSQNINPNYYLLGSIICMILFLICLILICIFYKSIKVSLAILKASSRFLQDNMCILFVPIAFFLVTVIYILYWITIALYLYSCGTLQEEYTMPFGQFDYSKEVRYLGFFWLFNFFWTIQFWQACSSFIIISAVAIWYFNQINDADVIGPSIKNLFKYHLGTIAFGSLLVALVQFARAILEYVDNQTKKTQNQIMKILATCCKCCLWCFEKFIKFINKTAYVVTAVKSKSFLPAAADAIQVVMMNPGRVAMVNTFSFLFETLGNLCISLLTGLISYLLLTNLDRYSGLDSPIPTTIVCIIISYIIANFWMELYSTSADAMIIVFCIDEQCNQQYGGNSMHPKELDAFLDDFDKDGQEKN